MNFTNHFKDLVNKTIKSVIEKPCFDYEYEVDEQNFEVIAKILINCCDYACSIEDDPHYLEIYKKGILLFGSVGSGKSDAFKIAKVFRAINPKCKKLNWIHAKDLVSDYAVVGERSFDFYTKDDYVFDEIGAVNETPKHYGNTSNVIAEIIMLRYDLWKNEGIRSYFTTNLSLKELSQKYGDRIFSRLVEMCSFYQLNSEEDRRFLSKKYKPLVSEIDEEDSRFINRTTGLIKDGMAYSQKAKNEILEILRNIYKKYNQVNELHKSFRNEIENLAEMVKNAPEDEEIAIQLAKIHLQNTLNKFRKQKI